MRSMGIPEKVVTWIQRKMEGHKTRLTFDDFTSALFEIISGLDQGCTLSVLLYKIYNQLLLVHAEHCRI
ncbi:hypothetical protein FOMPIDRAFT_1136589 [Fomitopsis schrenkii]|uniref:Reverse transcriptase domain-containing protein n=1 Tax=Fomitopsis schrenkii TaxID=2126942 RepID=S8EU82_FOMSC|nr:hypothetical protein FOMPIDRAFT_1136589 [Fomitopsis schrenkii]